MNARQKCKQLKRRNKLLMEIVNNNSELLRLYDMWTRPLVVDTSYIPLTEYKAQAVIRESHYGELAITLAKESVRRELAEALANHIDWARVSPFCDEPVIEGRIRIAEKRESIADETYY